MANSLHPTQPTRILHKQILHKIHSDIERELFASSALDTVAANAAMQIVERKLEYFFMLIHGEFYNDIEELLEKYSGQRHVQFDNPEKVHLLREIKKILGIN